MCLLAAVSFAHQPRLVSEASQANPYLVTDPEVSRVFYGELDGQPAYFKITSDRQFNLSFNLLIPDVGGSEKYGLKIYVSDDSRRQLFLFEPSPFEWKPYYEEFGNDWYLDGPKASRVVPAGTYWIRVFSDNNQGKYALAIGGDEQFPPQEAIGALLLMPIIKEKFFGKPVFLPMVHELGIVLILASLIALALSVEWSRKSRENNKSVVSSFFSVRKLAWAGIIIFVLSGVLTYLTLPHDIILLSELGLGLLAILLWLWISIDAAFKFSQVTNQKVLLSDKYLKSVRTKLIVSLIVWLIVLVLSLSV